MFSELELRSSPSAQKLSLRLIPRRAADSTNPARELLEVLSRHFHVTVAGTASGFVQRYPLLDGGWLEAPPEAFIQVNWEVNLRLVEAVVRGARALAARSYVDVYAGAGNFTLALARAGIWGVSIEGHRAAAHAAENSLRQQQLLDRVIVMAEDAGTALARLSRGSEAPDLCVLDPPRAGAPEILDSVCALRPRSIAYCSCDPVTLARDLRSLVDRGYRLETLRAFDMFPGTHHVETLVWLSDSLPRSS
jgi:23S rRNA (uracil1939-C5)-methyltransferase